MVKLLAIFAVALLFCEHSQSLRLISIVKSTAITSGKPYPYATQSLTTTENKEEPKSVIILDGKAIPYTKVKSSLSTPDLVKQNPSEVEEIEEGVGPAASVDYSPAVPLENLENGDNETGEDLKVEISDVHPVYVKPPNDFKPRIFPIRRVDGVESSAKDIESATLPPPSKPLPYPYPNGLTSWITGGIRGLQRGGFWESLASDESLHGYKPDRTPVDIASWFMRPLTQLLPRETVIPPSMAYRPPLPPHRRLYPQSMSRPQPLSSWLFRGMKDTPSNNWEIPSMVIEKIEVVPLSSKASHQQTSSSLASAKVATHNYIEDLMTSDGDVDSIDDSQAKRNEYRPLVAATVLFETEPEYYNVVSVD